MWPDVIQRRLYIFWNNPGKNSNLPGPGRDPHRLLPDINHTGVVIVNFFWDKFQALYDHDVH